MYNELMIGYAAAVTYVDKQLGRVLDVLDELQLWDNLTVVLTADHGMHNGEKGLWEKWSLFEESTRYVLSLLVSSSF
jgi:iduronate 2-sulfatase